MSGLSKLTEPKNREALLLAEVAAWLHDWRKCSDEHLKVMTKTFFNECLKRNQMSFLQICPHTNLKEIESAQGLQRSSMNSFFPSIYSQIININGFSVSLEDLISGKSYGFRGREDKSLPWPVFMGRVAHHCAHLEKEKEEKDYEGSQCWPCIYSSSAFGYEQNLILNLTQELRACGQSTTLNTFRKDMKNAWKRALADTRRPINEVRLEDWAVIVGSLYKTEMARYLITASHGVPAWRLLSVRTDGLEWCLSSSKISDLQARQDILQDGLDRVQMALECNYPLGLEVYRDENGSVFVVPDILHLDAVLMDMNAEKSLRQYILEQFAQGTVQNNPRWAVKSEIVPDIYIDLNPWKGRPIPLELPPIARNWKDPSEKGHLEREVSITSDPEFIADSWERKDEICTVCGLRPQGYGAHDRLEHYRRRALKKECPRDCQTCKAIERGVCSICEQRRDDRSMRWARKKLSSTIWIDEVADTKGRLALVAGYFDLNGWLRGDLVRTMAVCNPANSESKEAEKVAKNPSFARLRRIWETTRGFWQEVYPTDENGDLQKSVVGDVVGLAGPRLEISGALKGKNGAKRPGPYHAYDLVLSKGIKLSVAWDPEEGRREEPKGRFITIDNLIYFVSLAGNKAPTRERDESEEDYALRLHRWAAEKLRELIKGPIRIEESTGYGGKAKEWGEINVDPIDIPIDIIPNSRYTPAIPILAEPRTFMALVPADKALKVVDGIKTKYEREMGKVRNRLPLHIGIIYAHRRTPLRAILDGGRRMLKQNFRTEGWKVICAARKLGSRNDQLPERFHADKDGQFCEWLEILLEKDGRRVNWFVPAVMGDGRTPDHWYPFVFLNSSSEPLDRGRRFKALNPWTGSDGWLIHASDLRTDDVVYFTPATLDFQWLDSAGRRFEIAYDERGQRRGLSRRPYLLDELENLNGIWETLSNHLKKNQIYILRDLIETKRTEWQIDDQRSVEDSIFKEFCREALVNAEWKNGELPWEAEGKDRKEWLDRWADYAVRGWITDTIELHLQIMKEEVQDEL